MDYITATDLASSCRTRVRGFSKDPGGRCERPRGVANLRRQVDMAKHSYVRLEGIGRDDRRGEGSWQDPVAQMVVERLGEDNPLFGRVVFALGRLLALSVQLTPEVVDRVIEQEAARPAPRQHAKPAHHRRPRATSPTGTAVVYYMRLGNRVKIGTTTNLATRMASINPEEVLALEPGGHALEHLRHRQFADLRTKGEWFKYQGKLVDHIASIRRTA